MKKIPTTKVAQAVEIIRETIGSGEWSTYIPSERTLARDLMISRASLRQALDNLTQEGILAPVERSKRRKISKQPQTKKLSTTKRVVFLTPELAHKATPLVLEQIAKLRYYLSNANITVDVISSPVFRQTQSSSKTLLKLVTQYPDAHWVLHQCPVHIQEWFAKDSVSATVLGSLFHEIKLPNVDVDFQSACRHAAGTLIAKGHKRIGLIRCRSNLAGDELATVGMTEAIQSHHGESLPDPVILSHDFHVDRLTVDLNRLFTSSKYPTGVIVLNHHHFVTAYSCLMSMGIRIPNDVSMIALSHDAFLDRLSPLPVCYTVGDQLIYELARLILNPSSGNSTKSTLLIPEAIPGETVGVCQG